MPKRPINIVLFISLLMLFGMAAAQDATNAQVKNMFTTLRLRAAPSPTAAVITELIGGTPINVIGRTAGSGWLKVEVDSETAGWVSSGYVELFTSLDSVPILYETSAAPASVSAAPTSVPSSASTADEPEGRTSGARVMSMAGTLRLRQEPTTLSAILAELLPGTGLEIAGRSEDGAWLNVTTTDGQTGWVSAAYVVIGGTAPTIAPPTTAGTSLPSAEGMRGVRAIYAHGQALGNQRNVFTKIGDSMTTSTESLDAIGRGIVTLGSYGGLQRVIDTFMSGSFNSFTHVSAAAGPGWTTMTALEPRFRNTAICQIEVSSVECELDRVKPSIALIQLGTNDMQYINADTFAYNLTRIVDLCIDKGVVPVLATIPYRDGYGASVDAFNDVIRGVAASRDVPVWDVKGALDGLPNRGLSGDGIHPSSAPGGYADSANFANGEAMQAGYVARNLTALQILDSTLNMLGG